MFSLLGLAVVIQKSPAHPADQVILDELTALIGKNPHQPSLWMSRGRQFHLHGQRAEAEVDFQEARRLDPAFPGVDLALAELAYESGRDREASRYLESVLAASSPAEPAALILRARLAARSGHVREAWSAYDTALTALAQPTPELYLEQAALPLPPEELLRGVDAAIARIGPAWPLMERALGLAEALGRTDDVLRRIDVLTASAERPELWLQRRGDVLRRAGRADAAADAYRRALEALAQRPDWLRRSSDGQALEDTLRARLTP